MIQRVRGKYPLFPHPNSLLRRLPQVHPSMKAAVPPEGGQTNNTCPPLSTTGTSRMKKRPSSSQQEVVEGQQEALEAVTHFVSGEMIAENGKPFSLVEDVAFHQLQ